MDFVKQQEKVYAQLIEDHPVSVGKKASARERDKNDLRASTLVYGEIKFEPYAITLQKIKKLYGGLAGPGGVFCDIGSGTGKPCFAAALLHDFDRVIGIEILENLH